MINSTNVEIEGQKAIKIRAMAHGMLYEIISNTPCAPHKRGHILMRSEGKAINLTLADGSHLPIASELLTGVWVERLDEGQGVTLTQS